jgi:diaminohydroxyphosphoribosylaminopyrimidine deaminase/5-amino-6-(5-phosphoribosylamino)uracil reductase
MQELSVDSVDGLNDDQIMQLVLDLASSGQYTTHPNPKVGCVLVKDNQVVGQGWHESAGSAHAERVAIERAGEAARGSVAYVSMEPCCHQGRTPPCTDALINAGVAKVVAAMSDPNPLVSGGGFQLLTAAGIEVESDVLSAQASWMNRGFVSRMRRNRPWVLIKSAATLDGRIAAFDGESKWITSADSRQNVQEIRAGVSAIVTGIGTVLADDPQMNVRLDTGRQPLRVVLDTDLKIPLDARIIGSDGNLIVFTHSQDQDKIAQLTVLGVEVIAIDKAQQGYLDLHQVLSHLHEWQCNEVLVEAGPTVSGQFMQADLVDELVLFYAGSVLGDQGAAMFNFNTPLAFNQKKEYKIADVSMLEDDFRVIAVNPESQRQITVN